MKILVTGAAGFIASHVAEAFAKDGHQVVGLDNFSEYYSVSLKKQNAVELEKFGVQMLHFDLRQSDFFSLPSDFDFIFHFAAHPGISSSSSFEDYFSNNLVATKNLLDFASLNKALKMFVNIATSSVYGAFATQDETSAAQPLSWYGVTKLAAEQLALAQSRAGLLHACSLRLYSVYGPRERPDKLFTKLIAAAYKNDDFPLFEGSEKHLRSFTYVGDVVSAMTAVMQRHESLNGEIVNIGTDAEFTTADGIKTVEEILGKKIQLIALPPRAGDQSRTKANIDKAKKLLHYAPNTLLKDGLIQQVKWYKANFT